ncbi:hypothetical protein Tco_0591513 [Tanacetum coccineum]
MRCLDYRDQYVVLTRKVDTSYPTGGYGVSVDLSEQLDTAYSRGVIRRIGNCLYAFSCEELALIRRISFLDTTTRKPYMFARWGDLLGDDDMPMKTFRFVVFVDKGHVKLDGFNYMNMQAAANTSLGKFVPKGFLHQGVCVSLLNVEESISTSQLMQAVEEFDDVFGIPKELPPKRSHDHIVPLIKGTPPMNIRPYKHPPMQKYAIEVMVKELLEAGVIRPS